MISDLDELVLSCRSAVGRAQIQEAVNCYRAGAYRSTIIATWIAVLFDFISKLRELEMSGDARAAAKLAEFDGARQNGDISASLTFERTLVNSACKDFELLSPIEATDIQRLLEDRNRCAHSSMLSTDEPYSPSAELARAHVESAVSFFIRHPPVQGKAALERVFQDVKSEYFPTEDEQALAFFQSGPLGRARAPLVRSVVIGITKDLLSETRVAKERLRQFAALRAIARLYSTEFKAALATLLPEKASKLPDEDFFRLIRYVRQIDSAWSAIGHAAQIRAVKAVQSATPEKLMRFIAAALGVSHLRSYAALRIAELDVEQLGRLVAVHTDTIYIKCGLELLGEVNNFREAEAIFEKLLIPLASEVKPEDLSQIVTCCEKNHKIYDAFQMPTLLQEFLKSCPLEDALSVESWRTLHRLAADELHFVPEPEGGMTLEEALRTRFGFDAPKLTKVALRNQVTVYVDESDIRF